MPAKPKWYGRLAQIVTDLEALPLPWVTRGTVEFMLGVGPRRAQQIIAPCAVEQIGSSLVADRRLLILHLRALAGGEDAHYESERQRKLARVLDGLRRDWVERPKLLVAAPLAIVNQRINDLPDGVVLAHGRITIEFTTPVEALEKLLALAMAVGQDMAGFEALTAGKLGS